jgi:putative ABC transport system permease protein
MLRHLLRSTWLHLLRHRSHAVISIAGLALALACSLLIGLHVAHELSWDRYQPEAERIARIVFDWREADGSYLEDATTPTALAHVLRREVPEVEAATYIMPPWGASRIVRRDSLVHYEDRVYRSDAHYFRVFDHTFLEGDPATALSSPDALVLTRSTARRYFGESPALGRTLVVGGQSCRVSGVVEDIPPEAHYHFDLLHRADRYADELDPPPEENWARWNFYTYVRLEEGASPAELEAQTRLLLDRHNPDEPIDWSAPRLRPVVQPLLEIHLDSQRRWELEPSGDRDQVRLFALVAALVLLIASFNFLNLALARTLLRAGEVGVRKVAGARSGQLALQFLLEVLLQALLALAAAVVLVELALPGLNRLFGLQLSLAPLLTLPGVLALLGGLLAVAVLSGAWPAFALASLQPVQVLKGPFAGAGRGVHLRRVLVTVQFAITIALLVATAVFYQQYRYMSAATRTLPADRVVVAPLRGDSHERYEALRERLLADPAVEAVTAGSGIPGGLNWTTRLSTLGGEQNVLVNFLFVEPGFPEALGFELAEGRGFRTGSSPDPEGALLMNESAARLFDRSSMLGAQLQAWGGERQVVGVLEDFHFRSFRHRIAPFALVLSEQRDYLFVRVAPGRTARALDHLRSSWGELVEELPIQYSFLSGTFADHVRGQERASTLVAGFSGFAVLIALLGLYGLAAFAAQRRRREVAIRKVLGASPPALTRLLAREFVLLVLAAGAVALPAAWWASRSWLEGFAYRIELDPLPFAAALALVLLLAAAVAASQALLVARRNPVLYLREE